MEITYLITDKIKIIERNGQFVVLNRGKDMAQFSDLESAISEGERLASMLSKFSKHLY